MTLEKIMSLTSSDRFKDNMVAKSMSLFLITFAFPLKALNLSLPWWLVSGFYQGNHLLFKEQEKRTSWLGFLLSLTDSELCSLPVSTSGQEIMAYSRFHPLIVSKKNTAFASQRFFTGMKVLNSQVKTAQMIINPSVPSYPVSNAHRAT